MMDGNIKCFYGLNRLVIVFILSIWFTWYELCWGYGKQVLPGYFRSLYWINIGVLFGITLSFAFKSWRLGFGLTPLVGIIEDIIITTIHRSCEHGLWYALTHWNLRDHPYFGSGTAWFINYWSKQLFNHDPRLDSLHGFIIAILFTLFFPVMTHIDTLVKKYVVKSHG